MTDRDEKFFELVETYTDHGCAALEDWSTDDLLDLKEVIEAELEARDAFAQQEYFDRQEYIEDEQQGAGERYWFTDDDSYGGTE